MDDLGRQGPLTSCIVNMWNRLIPLLTLLLTPVGPAWSQETQTPEDPKGLRPAILDSGRRSMAAERMREDERIVLDGVLDEPVWQRTVPASDFIQQDPVLGGTPTERTEVRIGFNRTTLYMGVICYDSEPDLLLGNTMKRDEFLSADDRFMWTMDPFLDQQNGYFFEMNPSGLMADQLLSPAGSNRDWDGIWNAVVRRSAVGWTLEIEIPFGTISFDPDAPAWGINFQRTVRRKNEENLWTGYLRNQGLRRLEYGGLLTGIIDVSQGVGLDVVPYVAGNMFDAPGAATPQDLDGGADVGIDLFYNVTPSLRANLTVNTDFAETEVDQRLVNLTRFPLFFPEKRAFFLDGATFFNFYGEFTPVRPFFSRRIGLDEEGQQQPIVIGGKLIGQTGSQDVGVLYVRTDETATVAGEDFAVARLRHRFWAQSYVGAIYTGSHTQRGNRRSANGRARCSPRDGDIPRQSKPGRDRLLPVEHQPPRDGSQLRARRPHRAPERSVERQLLVRVARRKRRSGGRIRPTDWIPRLQSAYFLLAAAGGPSLDPTFPVRALLELHHRHGQPVAVPEPDGR